MVHELRQCEGVPHVAHSQRGGTEGWSTGNTKQCDDAGKLRRNIQALKAARVNHQAHRKYNQYKGRSPEQQKLFHARFRIPRTDNYVGKLEDAGELQGVKLANHIQEAWRPIMAAVPTATEAKTSWFENCHARYRLDDTQQQSLEQPITAAEVKWSIRKCTRGKATGPDRLPNDFFRNLEAELVPCLVHVFNAALEHGHVPRSFLKASIFLLKKVAAPATGLDFRPLSMLNTDYKVLTRILARRMRPLLPLLLHPEQSGFVPGRSIHTTIRRFTQAKEAARKARSLQDACSVQLDFAKAYDSLDREFMMRALEKMGLPPRFSKLVDALHQGTTTVFKVDGYKSNPMQVTSGIRQGCPMAPQLFVLAIESLYTTFERHPGLQGVRLPSNDGGRLVVTGYADDTNVYLSNKTEAMVMDGVLSDFAAASGLRINKQKTAVINLREDGAAICTGYNVKPLTRTTRYLGIPVATKPDVRETWDTVTHQLQARLGMAARKTSNPLQRIQLINAIAVPKILFVSQHAWPTATITEEMQKFIHKFIWRGDFRNEAATAKYSRATAARSTKAGGMAYPILRHLLFAQAGAIVASRHRGKCMARHLQPSRGKKQELKLEGSIERVGDLVLSEHYAQRRSEDERRAIQYAYDAVDNGEGPSYSWEDGSLLLNVQDWNGKLNDICKIQKKEHGQLNRAWIRFMDLRKSHALYIPQDHPHWAKQLRIITDGGWTLANIADITWLSATISKWKPRLAFPLTNDQATAFASAIIVLSANYPGILHRTPEQHELTVSTQELETLYLLPSQVLLRDGEDGNKCQLAVVAHASQLAEIARRRYGSTAAIGSTPHLLSEANYFVGTAPSPATFASLKKWIGTSWNEPITQPPDTTSSTEHWTKTALAQLDWKTIHANRTMTAGTRWLWINMKHGRMSSWDPTQGQSGCPYDTCRGPKHNWTHTFFECPAARAAWTSLARRWHSAANWNDTDECISDALQWRTPGIPDRLLNNLTEMDADDADNIIGTLDAIWVTEVTSLIQAVWKARLDWLFRPTEAAAMPAWRAAAAWQHRASTDVTWSNRRIRNAIYNTLEYPEETTDVPTTQDDTILFFDGGSRGNPGPGAAGAVIVKMTPQPHVHWVGYLHSATPVTNNQMEASALLMGVNALKNQGLVEAHVVGDSHMILTQHALLRLPKHKALKQLYWKTRTSISHLRISSWSHHYRAYNKMADAAVNLALDSKTSREGPPTFQHQQILEHLSSDIQAWLRERSTKSHLAGRPLGHHGQGAQLSFIS